MFPDRIVSAPVLLRSFTPHDAPRVQQLAGDFRVADPTGVIPHPYADGMAESWIASHEHERATGEAFTYAVTQQDDSVVVGAIALRPAVNEHENLGYWIGHPYWGRGYATAAARGLIALAFSWLDCDVVTAKHLSRNPASGRVLEKCGFVPIRRAHEMHRGVNEEYVVWGITADAWARWIDQPPVRDAATRAADAS